MEYTKIGALMRQKEWKKKFNQRMTHLTKWEKHRKEEPGGAD